MDLVIPIFRGIDGFVFSPVLRLLGAIVSWIQKIQSECFRIFVPKSMIGVVVYEVFVNIF